MSSRNFIRRFKAATGRLPGEYIQMLRIAAAKALLESDRTVPIHRLCTRIGYEDPAFFRDVFKRHTGMTPAQYRDRFAGMSMARGEVAGA
jgi:transcriptional regulator GlxA family with amidase domain